MLTSGTVLGTCISHIVLVPTCVFLLFFSEFHIWENYVEETNISQRYFRGAGWDEEEVMADEKVLEKDASNIASLSVF